MSEKQASRNRPAAGPHTVNVMLELPAQWRKLRIPKALNRRLHDLLDKQDDGYRLSAAEKREAAALVELNEMLSLIKLRAAEPRGQKKA